MNAPLARQGPSIPRRLRIGTIGPLLALVLLIVLGTLINPTFLSVANLTNVLTRTAFIGIIAVGATMVIIAGGIDLSVGSMAAWIAGVMIIVMNGLVATMGTGWPTILVGMAVGVALGIAAGLVNGLVSTRGGVDAFIVTLGTMGILRSFVTYFANGGTLSLNFGIRDLPPRLLREPPRCSHPRPRARRRRPLGRPAAQLYQVRPVLPGDRVQ